MAKSWKQPSVPCEVTRKSVVCPYKRMSYSTKWDILVICYSMNQSPNHYPKNTNRKENIWYASTLLANRTQDFRSLFFSCLNVLSQALRLFPICCLFMFSEFLAMYFGGLWYFIIFGNFKLLYLQYFFFSLLKINSKLTE